MGIKCPCQTQTQIGRRVIWLVFHSPTQFNHRSISNHHRTPTEEHHIANLDPSAFFTLHDYDNSGMWTARDIRRTYGLDDETAKEIDDGKKQDITKIVVEIFDRNGDGMISRQEWIEGWVKDGKRLPDFGVGNGHCLPVAGINWAETLSLLDSWARIIGALAVGSWMGLGSFAGVWFGRII